MKSKVDTLVGEKPVATVTYQERLCSGRFKVAIFAFCGGLVGISSIVLSSRINSAHPGIGLGYELDAIAAVVIGGAIIGALTMAAIRFGLNVMAVTPFIQQIVIGVILIIAVYLDRLRILQEAMFDRLRAK